MDIMEIESGEKSPNQLSVTNDPRRSSHVASSYTTGPPKKKQDFVNQSQDYNLNTSYFNYSGQQDAMSHKSKRGDGLTNLRNVEHPTSTNMKANKVEPLMKRRIEKMRKDAQNLANRLRSPGRSPGATTARKATKGSLKTCVLSQHLDMMSSQLQQFSPILKMSGTPATFQPLLK